MPLVALQETENKLVTFLGTAEPTVPFSPLWTRLAVGIKQSFGCQSAIMSE